MLGCSLTSTTSLLMLLVEIAKTCEGLKIRCVIGSFGDSKQAKKRRS
jgi:hypothetical protein